MDYYGWTSKPIVHFASPPKTEPVPKKDIYEERLEKIRGKEQGDA